MTGFDGDDEVEYRDALARASQLKGEGNGAFTRKEYDRAVENYTEALLTLAAVGAASSSGSDEARAVLLTNRAAAYLQQRGKAEAAEEDCSAALAIDPHRAKALFRRAQALEMQDKETEALKDLGRVLQQHRTDKPALALREKIMHKLFLKQQQQESTSVVEECLKKIKEDCQSQNGAGPETVKYLKGMTSEVVDKPWLAGELLHSDNVPVWRPLLDLEGGDSEVLEAAIRLLAICVTRKEFALAVTEKPLLGVEQVGSLVSGTGVRVAASALTWLVNCLEHDDAVMVAGHVEDEAILLQRPLPPKTKAKAKKGSEEGKQEADADTETDTEAKEAGASQQEEATGPLEAVWTEWYPRGRDGGESAFHPVPSAAAFVKGLQHEDRAVRELAMDGVVKWSSEATESAIPADPKEASTAQGRKRAHRRRLARSFLARDKALALLGGEGSAGLKALFELGDSEAGTERRKAAATIGWLTMRVAGAVNQGEAKLLDQRHLQAIMEPFLRFGDHNAKEDRSLSRLSAVTRRVGLAGALAAVDPEMGQWSLSREGAMEEVCILAGTGEAAGQECAGEALCALAGFDAGRALLGPAVESGVLFTLMEQGAPSARAAAAACYTKLGLISQAMKGDSQDITRLLNVSLDVITQPFPTSASAPTPSPSEAAPAKNTSVSHSHSSTNKPTPDPERERAVEVLSFLMMKTMCREDICHGSSRCSAAMLPRLCSTAANLPGGGSSPLAYGLSFIFSALSISQEEAKKESFKDKDMTYEQYQQMQQLAEQHGQAKPPDPLDEDSYEAALRRCQKMVQAGVVPALIKLVEGAPSNITMACASAALRHLAACEEVRGLMIQQGALNALYRLSGEEGNTATRQADAMHAVAKLLVTTNPNVLPDHTLFSALGPLLALCQDSNSSDLMKFESLMALTNLITTGFDMCDRIVSAKGCRTIGYLQFSEHEMVRRAATEALCNLLVHPAARTHISHPNHMKLWLAFTGLVEDDRPTALAAMGGLAMAAGDEGVSLALVKAERGVEVLVEVLEEGDAEFAHRAAAALAGICSQPAGSEVRQLLEREDKDQGCMKNVLLRPALERSIKRAKSKRVKANKDASKGGKAAEATAAAAGAWAQVGELCVQAVANLSQTQAPAPAEGGEGGGG